MIERIQLTLTPIDGSIYIERPLADEQQIDTALEKARIAQVSWRQVPVAERAGICRGMLDWCLERADQLGIELTRQIGRPIAYSPFEIRRGF